MYNYTAICFGENSSFQRVLQNGNLFKRNRIRIQDALFLNRNSWKGSNSNFVFIRKSFFHCWILHTAYEKRNLININETKRKVKLSIWCWTAAVCKQIKENWMLFCVWMLLTFPLLISWWFSFWLSFSISFLLSFNLICSTVAFLSWGREFLHSTTTTYLAVCSHFYLSS